MSWWRRNRWGLVLLVPALALMLVASGIRMLAVHREVNYTREHPPENFSQTFTDFSGEQRYKVTRITFVSMQRVDLDDVELPPNGAAWVSELRFEAPLDSPIDFCHVKLFDEAGREFVSNITLIGADSSMSQVTCTPREDRSTSWSKRWMFVLPDDAVPSWLRISWAPPDYIRVPLK